MLKQDFLFMMLDQDLVIILETVRIIAIALSPVTPSLSWRIYAQLGYSRDQFDAATWVSSLSLSYTHAYTNQNFVTHTFTYTHIYIYTHISVYTYIHTCIYTHIYMSVYICIRVYTHMTYSCF